MYTPVIMTRGDRFRLIKMKLRCQRALAVLDAEEATLKIRLATVHERMVKAGIPIPLDKPIQQTLPI